MSPPCSCTLVASQLPAPEPVVQIDPELGRKFLKDMKDSEAWNMDQGLMVMLQPPHTRVCAVIHSAFTWMLAQESHAHWQDLNKLDPNKRVGYTALLVRLSQCFPPAIPV